MRIFWMIVALFRRDRSSYLEMSTERRQMNVRYHIAEMIVLAGIVWVGPKLTPAQAADVMRNAGGVANRTNVVTHQGPTFAVTSSTEPSAGPWAFPPPTPARRLDGTLLSDPITIYGRTYHRR